MQRFPRANLLLIPQRYLRRLESELRGMGFRAPIFLMLSGGGLATMETACRFPIRMIESGPAGGAIWSAPTVDVKRGALYVGVGNTYSGPAQPTNNRVQGNLLHGLPFTSDDFDLVHQRLLAASAVPRSCGRQLWQTWCA